LAHAHSFSPITLRLSDCFRWWFGTIPFCLLFILKLKALKIKQPAEAIVLGLVSGLMGIYLLFLLKWDQNLVSLIYTSVGIGLISTISSKVANLIAKSWMYLGQAMGKVIGSVLLAIVYLLILTPIAILQKVFSGKGKFKVKKTADQSTWLERKHNFSKEDLEELW
jgi:hypothetical protein